MKKKEEVYVVVDTPKKAKKLKKVLEMFGESTYSKETITSALNDGLLIKYDTTDSEWLNSSYDGGKQQVSIKELRNILAVENLKKGDIIMVKEGSVTAIGKYVEHDDYGFDVEDEGCFDNFVRYATDEEKELFNTKKELEVGKWYKFEAFGHKYLLNYNGSGWAYGFMDSTYKKGWCFSKGGLQSNAVGKEATAEEVETALIAEAKRRYKVGDKLSRLSNFFYGAGNNTYNGIFNENSFSIHNQSLSSKTTNGFYHAIFKDGKWAEVIKPETEMNLMISNPLTITLGLDKINKVYVKLKIDEIQNKLKELKKLL